MRIAAITLSLALVCACAPAGGQRPMTPSEPSSAPRAEHPAAATAQADATAAETAEVAPVRDLRTATFALG